MSAFSLTFMQKMARHICHVTNYTFQPLYLGFGDSSGDENATSVTGYARQPISFTPAHYLLPAGDVVQCENDAGITFGPLSNFPPTPFGGFGTARLFDAPTGGNNLWNIQVSPTGSRVDGCTLTVAAGVLVPKADAGGAFFSGPSINASATTAFLIGVMDLMLRGIAYQPDLYLALARPWSTSDHTGSTPPAYTELTEPGYARIAANGIWQAEPSIGNCSNAVDVTWSASADWVNNLFGMIMMDAASGGNLLFGMDSWGTGASPPKAGDSITYPASTPGITNSHGLYL